MFGLARHPEARCGGELCNDRPAENEPAFLRNKLRRDFNLCKVFSRDWKDPRTAEALAGAVLVYLRRRDRAAQLASWEKACVSGLWMPGQRPAPAPFPANAAEQIDEAEALFAPRADLVVEFEDLVADPPATFSRILAAAGWDPLPLELPAIATES